MAIENLMPGVGDFLSMTGWEKSLYARYFMVSLYPLGFSAIIFGPLYGFVKENQKKAVAVGGIVFLTVFSGSALYSTKKKWDRDLIPSARQTANALAREINDFAGERAKCPYPELLYDKKQVKGMYTNPLWKKWQDSTYPLFKKKFSQRIGAVLKQLDNPSVNDGAQMSLRISCETPSGLAAMRGCAELIQMNAETLSDSHD